MSTDFANINPAGLTDEGSYTPDKLHDRETLARKRVIASGAGVLPRGTVLGKITASSKYVTSASASSDGSQTPVEILAEPVDATSADVEAITYIKGRFNQAALTLGTGHTLSSIADALADRNIYLEPVIG